MQIQDDHCHPRCFNLTHTRSDLSFQRQFNFQLNTETIIPLRPNIQKIDEPKSQKIKLYSK